MTDVLNDYGKLLVILVALVGGLVLAVTGLVVGNDAGMASGTGLAGIVVGYVTGNGRLAARREAPSPLLAPKLPTNEYVHLDELDPAIRRRVVMDRIDPGARTVRTGGGAQGGTGGGPHDPIVTTPRAAP